MEFADLPLYVCPRFLVDFMAWFAILSELILILQSALSLPGVLNRGNCEVSRHSWLFKPLGKKCEYSTRLPTIISAAVFAHLMIFNFCSLFSDVGGKMYKIISFNQKKTSSH